MSNTGAPCTGIEASIDYFGVSFLENSVSKTVIQRILGRDSVWHPCRALYGYTQGLRVGNIAIYSGGNCGSVYVEVTGKGCRDIERIHGFYGWNGWAKMIEEILLHGLRITRIDFTFDDRSGLISYERFLRKIRQKAVVSGFREAVKIEKLDLTDASVTGTCLLFGSTHSDLLVRAYDKALQTKSGPVSDRPSTWTRLEIQCRHDYAQSLAMEFTEKGFAAILGDLRARLSFRIPSKTDRNRGRWRECDWWLKFLGSTPVQPIQVVKPQAAEESTAANLVRQYGPFLGSLQETPEGSEILDWILESSVDRHESKKLDQVQPEPKRILSTQRYKELRAKVYQDSKGGEVPRNFRR